MDEKDKVQSAEQEPLNKIGDFKNLDRSLSLAVSEGLNALLQDSDAAQEKELVRDFLRKYSKNFSFAAVGDSNTGKTSLLRVLFGDFVSFSEAPAQEIREYCYGDEAGEYVLNPGHIKVFQTAAPLKGVSVIDTKGTDLLSTPEEKEALQNVILKSDVLLAVFDAANVSAFSLWDYLEKVEARKIVFVMTKEDLCPKDLLDTNTARLMTYISEAGLQAPIFHVRNMNRLLSGKSEMGENDGNSAPSDSAKLNLDKNALPNDSKPGKNKEKNTVTNSAKWFFAKKNAKDKEVSENNDKNSIKSDSAKFDFSETQGDGSFTGTGVSGLKEYIDNFILKGDLGLRKEKEAVSEMRGLFVSLENSFALRKRQFQEDQKVVEKINQAMDGFIGRSGKTIDSAKTSLKRVIEKSIDDYENEIVSRLDPKTIRERFPKGQTDFLDYMNFINESYRSRMEGEVDRKTQEAVKEYLGSLEQVLEEATGYFRDRKTILALEDRFYGSLAESKQQMIKTASEELTDNREYYGKLGNASNELFMKLWRKRVKRDSTVNAATGIGAGAGLVGGAVAGHMAAGAFAGALSMAVLPGAGAAALASAILWPAVAAVVGGVFVAGMAKKIASATSEEEMRAKTAEAIADFKNEVQKTRGEMSDRVLEVVEQIFRQELLQADSSFADYRKSVNIDGRNIPRLEEKIAQVQALMEKLDGAERIALDFAGNESG
ncbi:MAG: GTPase domain-containing protein [Lachnospiraceae bacterium]|nr:GTPase domain-containing protein [Lachnospiraceae bacterium]